MELTFNSKQTYLEFVENWKKEYRILSIEQRRRKEALKQAMREGETNWKLYADIESGKVQACNQLAIRALSKERAAEQYRLSRTEFTTT